MKGNISIPHALSDCEIGVDKEITVLVRPTENGEDGFKADVVKVVDYEEEKEEKEMPKEPSMGKLAPAAEKAMSYS